jgi:hypothetical protein
MPSNFRVDTTARQYSQSCIYLPRLQSSFSVCSVCDYDELSFCRRMVSRSRRACLPFEYHFVAFHQTSPPSLLMLSYVRLGYRSYTPLFRPGIRIIVTDFSVLQRLSMYCTGWLASGWYVSALTPAEAILFNTIRTHPSKPAKWQISRVYCSTPTDYLFSRSIMLGLVWLVRMLKFHCRHLTVALFTSSWTTRWLKHAYYTCRRWLWVL